MYATLKEVGNVHFREDSCLANQKISRRVELVEFDRGQLSVSQYAKLEIENRANAIHNHCQIGRVRVAKWVAIDPTESRDDSYAEPPLGYGIEAA